MKWSKKQTRSLIHIVKDLNMAIPPEETDPEWMNIDRFLKKSAGSSYKKFCRILRKFVTESSKVQSDWKFYQDIKEIVPQTFDEQENFNMPSVSEARCTACVFSESGLDVVQPLSETRINSAIPDPDAMFLKQLLPCMHNLNQRAKSEFKTQTLALMHKLQFN